jgi:short subunit dehydrogenase-like uncharacterized protein
VSGFSNQASDADRVGMKFDCEKTVLFLGHNGYTGRIVLEKLVGFQGVLAPNLTRTRTLKEQLEALKPHMKQGDLVVNCLGPFQSTYEPITQFCFETSSHYLDICAEWQVFEALFEMDARARDAGIMLLPGAGFDVVASDCMAAHVVSQLPDATRLQLAISGLELVSRGSARTMVNLMGQPVRVRRDGKLISCAKIKDEHFDFGYGLKPALAVSWGDISSAYHSTGVPNIEVYFEASPALMSAAFANRTFGWMFANSRVKMAADNLLARFPEGPSKSVRDSRSITLVARALDSQNNTVESRLTTSEAYTFTSDVVCDLVKRFSNSESPPGFQTPASVLGADYVLAINGSRRYDVNSVEE